MVNAVLNTIDTWGKPLALECFWLHEPFAVTRERKGSDYRVTHTPTGWAVLSNFDNRTHAIRFARLLRRSFRWETVTREGWDSLDSSDRHAMGVAICAAKFATSRAGRAA